MFVGACGYTGARVDHVGLSFRAGPPPCVAGYVDPPVTDPDGRRVAVAGSAFVRIRCRHVTDIDFESIGVPPEARLRLGADRFRVPAAENVVEVVRTGYRRSVLTLVVGLRHVAPMTGGMIQAGGKRHLEFVFGHQPPRRAVGEPRPVWWPGGPPVRPVFSRPRSAAPARRMPVAVPRVSSAQETTVAFATSPTSPGPARVLVDVCDSSNARSCPAGPIAYPRQPLVI